MGGTVGHGSAEPIPNPLGTMAEKSHEWNAVNETDPKLGRHADVEKGVSEADHCKQIDLVHSIDLEMEVHVALRTLYLDILLLPPSSIKTSPHRYISILYFIVWTVHHKPVFFARSRHTTSY